MQRYLKADKVLGLIFTKMLKEDKYEISIKDTSREISKISTAIREKFNITTLISSSDIYTLSQIYYNIFQLDNETIKLLKDSVLTDKVRSYFTEGIQEDVYNYIMSLNETTCLT